MLNGYDLPSDSKIAANETSFTHSKMASRSLQNLSLGLGNDLPHGCGTTFRRFAGGPTAKLPTDAPLVPHRCGTTCRRFAGRRAAKMRSLKQSINKARTE